MIITNQFYFIIKFINKVKSKAVYLLISRTLLMLKNIFSSVLNDVAQQGITKL